MNEIKIKTVEIKNDTINYFTFGTGKRTMVMMPGISIKSVMLLKDAVADAYACFNNDYTVYVFDRKSNINKDYSIFEMTDDFYEAFTKLNLKDIYFFGVSQGGMVGLLMAQKYGNILKKLFVGSAMVKLPQSTHKLFSRWMQYCKSHNAKLLTEDFANCLFSDEFVEKSKDTLYSPQNYGTDAEMDRFYYLVKACDTDIYDFLGKSEIPTIAVGSKADKVFGSEQPEMISKLLGCKYYNYEGYGHAVYDEAPDYKERILKFFEE